LRKSTYPFCSDNGTSLCYPSRNYGINSRVLRYLLGLWKYSWTVIPYEAPLERNKDPELEALDRYIIRLMPGYSLEQHTATTGYDIKKHIDGFLGQAVPTDRIVYIAREIPPEILVAIRADRGVLSVAPDYLLKLEPNWSGWKTAPGEGSPFKHDVKIYEPSSPRFPMEYDPASPPSPHP
jgi:hypothetical protein